MLMLHRRTTWPFLLLVCVLTAMGCDPIYKTHQAVEVSITGVESGLPVGNATVDLSGKYHEYWYPELTESARDKKWFDETQSKRCSTNEAGRVAVELEIYTICGGVYPGIFPGFDAEKDRVTDTAYLFRITRGEVQEMMTVVMRPGNVERGVSFAVEVLSIGDPTLEPSVGGRPTKGRSN